VKYVGVCASPGCGRALQWRGSGRKPRFCKDHGRGAAAVARNRARSSGDPAAIEAAGAARPEGSACCCEAWPKMRCPQHQEPTTSAAWQRSITSRITPGRCQSQARP
jgi:hypothetical protein